MLNTIASYIHDVVELVCLGCFLTGLAMVISSRIY